jgi:hypothetical protein
VPMAEPLARTADMTVQGATWTSIQAVFGRKWP